VPHRISHPDKRLLRSPFLSYYDSALPGEPPSPSIRHIPPSVSGTIQHRFCDLYVPASDEMEHRRYYCAEARSPNQHDDRQRGQQSWGNAWPWRPRTPRAILASALAGPATFRTAYTLMTFITHNHNHLS
jgi:hypothetical protein